MGSNRFFYFCNMVTLLYYTGAASDVYTKPITNRKYRVKAKRGCFELFLHANV